MAANWHDLGLCIGTPTNKKIHTNSVRIGRVLLNYYFLCSLHGIRSPFVNKSVGSLLNSLHYQWLYYSSNYSLGLST